MGKKLCVCARSSIFHSSCRLIPYFKSNDAQKVIQTNALVIFRHELSINIRIKGNILWRRASYIIQFHSAWKARCLSTNLSLPQSDYYTAVYFSCLFIHYFPIVLQSFTCIKNVVYTFPAQQPATTMWKLWIEIRSLFNTRRAPP